MLLYFYYGFLATKWLNMNNPGCNPGYKNKTHLKPWKGLILHTLYYKSITFICSHSAPSELSHLRTFKTPGFMPGVIHFKLFQSL